MTTLHTNPAEAASREYANRVAPNGSDAGDWERIINTLTPIITRHFAALQAERDALKSHNARLTDENIAACQMANDLAATIGQLEPGDHPDEIKPRAVTWLQERRNWNGEVLRLRSANAALEKERDKLSRDNLWLNQQLAKFTTDA